MSSLTSEQIVQLNEFGEANAWGNYYQCTPSDFAQKFKVEARKFGSMWVTMIPELDWAFFNRIVGLGIGSLATESMLDEAIGFLTDAGCKNYIAQICPLAQPSVLPEWLAARGFAKGGSWAKMVRGNEPAPSVDTDLRIESIGREHADDFARVALAAFEMPSELHPMIAGIVGKPGWHVYLAFDKDQPVSTAAMYVNDGIGWIGFGSTLESHRKRGGQGAMFARRIQDGLALGCKWFITETGEDKPESPNPSYHNMLRAGFKLVYLRPNYIHQPAAD